MVIALHSLQVVARLAEVFNAGVQNQCAWCRHHFSVLYGIAGHFLKYVSHPNTKMEAQNNGAVMSCCQYEALLSCDVHLILAYRMQCLYAMLQRCFTVHSYNLWSFVGIS